MLIHRVGLDGYFEDESVVGGLVKEEFCSAVSGRVLLRSQKSTAQP